MITGKNIQQVTLEELFSQDTDGSFPVLLDITHDNIDWGDTERSDGTEGDSEQENGHLRLINANYAVKYKSSDDTAAKTYWPCHFTFTLPSEDGKKVGSTSVSISCIDQRVIQVIRTIDDKPKCTLVAFFARSDSTVMFQKLYHYEFEMSNVSWDGVTAKWTLTYDPVMQLQVPRDLATYTRCPGVNDEN